MSNYENRFGGIKRLYGSKALNQFQNSHICVIGIGGVGSWVIEALARSGIGQLTLIDMDDICVTNTNRQIHALSDTVGEMKIEAMAARCRLINPEIKLNLIDDFIDKQNCFEYLSSEFDYIFDAIDSIHAKVALVAHCKRNKFPLLTCGGAGGQLDPTQIQVTDLARTIQDPLAAKVRSELRRFFNFSKNPKRKFRIDCVFSTEQLSYPDMNGEVCKEKADSDGNMKMDCATGFGASTMVTASFAFVGVAFMLKKMINKGQ
ncbi:tRNA cyclic N6-threonylcarbamoyladenosine(37) synthase TcdA [Psychromonas antarctica]|jgi:tRNA A37 threonylcarbamoyladenosine dehydratase|uniref:tRNA cyclic N6-threonylcarbamoyladenosine(37) synthase TcdA n=1 Tax=Psychromonas antarctica TaxID=67573 RepID=UPI001EE7C6CB|nr:tRNA cyclic N6-threonylcarbamoyladenosine(37) synthase TcdA [Psychromonas antarctica]MCG6200377.1 tRNA cyclic N6-threonylcarbamoyladenosine(37) synthase TcdA [Psychromonas antarctica]